MTMSFGMAIGNYSPAGALPAASPAAAAKSASVELNGVSTPCTTFKQCAGLLAPGATLYVSGEWNETLDAKTTSGTAANPINIVGLSAVINTTEAMGILFSGDYIHVSGFDISGTKSFGIYAGGKNALIENNVLHHNVTGNGTGGNCGISSSYGSALKLGLGSEDSIVRGNTVYENCGEGIAVTRGINILVEGNSVRDNYSMNIYVDNSPFVTIKNNTSVCTGIYLRSGERAMGIGLGEETYSGWGAQRHDINILDNVIGGCSYGIGMMTSGVNGILRNAVISGNTVTDGTIRSISVLSKNENVLIQNNKIYADLYVRYPTGVTLINNTIIGTTSSVFVDVPSSYWAVTYIESLYKAGITGGCSTSPLMYCPSSTVTRAQMAVFLLRGTHGSAYAPPSASGSVFGDVPANAFAAAWIEQLAAEGITAGCGSGNYCPDATVTRAQMAIFLLKSKYGSTYIPPAAAGVFSDVPAGSFAADWIEQLASEGITSGCGGGKYCPNSSVTRDQMAVFLVKTFNLP